MTNDGLMAERVRRLRHYGARDRYISVEQGFNSRLDEIQAAVLHVKLRHLDEWNAARRRLAARYDAGLEALPLARVGEASWAHSCRHLYVVRCAKRDGLRDFLAARGIQTEVHYPVAVHLQPAFAFLGRKPGAYPNAERACAEVLSLPLYPEMAETSVDAVVEAVREFFS